MSEKLTRAQFFEQLGGQKYGQLKELAEADGITLQATSKAAALEELWAHYTGAPVVVPAEAPPPVQGMLIWEGRMRGAPVERGYKVFRRAGHVFGREWKVLDPQPTEEQLQLLQNEKSIQVRIAK